VFQVENPILHSPAFSGALAAEVAALLLWPWLLMQDEASSSAALWSPPRASQCSGDCREIQPFRRNNPLCSCGVNLAQTLYLIFY